MYYVPQSKACQEYQEQYEKLASIITEVRLRKLDCSAYKRHCQEHAAHGLPELRLYIDGEEYIFQGNRSDNAVKSWVSTRIQPFFTYDKTLEQLLEIAKEKGQISAFVLIGGHTDVQILEERFKSLRGLAVVGFIEEATFEGKPVLKALTKLGEIKYKKSLRNPYDVRFFLQLLSLPICPLVSVEIFKLYEEAGKTAVLLFAHENNGAEIRAFQHFAEENYIKHQNDFAFGILDAAQFSKLGTDGNLSQNEATVLLFAPDSLYQSKFEYLNEFFQTYLLKEFNKLTKLILKPHVSEHEKQKSQTLNEKEEIVELEKTKQQIVSKRINVITMILLGVGIVIISLKKMQKWLHYKK